MTRGTRSSSHIPFMKLNGTTLFMKLNSATLFIKLNDTALFMKLNGTTLFMRLNVRWAHIFIFYVFFFLSLSLNKVIRWFLVKMQSFEALLINFPINK